MEELQALLILSSMPYIGSIRARFLMHHYGSAVAVLQISPEEISALPGFGPKILQGWKKNLNDRTWEQNLALIEKLEADIIPFNSPHYPKRLLEIADFPLILYVQGKLLKDEDQRSIAVVGTRQASVYGYEIAKQISQQLTQAGYTVISGLARGIDTAAHQGALESGRTIAILGSGLACLYPTENAQLAKKICHNGALISEFSMATPPDKQNFPQRNRIVSSMAALGTILIEAPEQSGAMLTARLAHEQGRPVYAFPGRIDQETFKGNHKLIKEKRAELIEGVEDVLKRLSDCRLPLVFKESQKSFIPLEKEEEELVNKMPVQEASVEELILQTKYPIARLNSLLMSLVLKKRVKEYPGKIYKKIID